MWLVLILVSFGCVGCFLGFADLVVGLGGLVLGSFVGCLHRLLVARSCGVRLRWCC